MNRRQALTGGISLAAATVLMPLAGRGPNDPAGVTVRDVGAFWSAQPFDLGLRHYEGDCDLCFLKGRGKLAAIIEINCETDFVAKNDDFLKFARDCAALVAEKAPADVAALSQLALGGSTVEATRAELVGRIGENLSLRRFVRIEGQGRIATYIHGGSKIGVVVDVTGGDEALAKDIAMHIAATKPVSLGRDEVPAELIEKERSIAAQKAAESGKPAEIVEKMVEGSVQKYLKEVTLLGQPFVKDDKQTIEQLLKSRGASVKRFVLFLVGEGIEKKQVDFAAEVAAAAKGV
jgi:elongation factor Ts